jgi:hypothetical protein
VKDPHLPPANLLFRSPPLHSLKDRPRVDPSPQNIGEEKDYADGEFGGWSGGLKERDAEGADQNR